MTTLFWLVMMQEYEIWRVLLLLVIRGKWGRPVNGEMAIDGRDAVQFVESCLSGVPNLLLPGSASCCVQR